MVSRQDIEFMRQARAEMIEGRQSDITITYKDGGGAVDPITGEPIGDGSEPRPAHAVVTEISSQVKIDRLVEDGINVEKGDIWFSVPIEEIADIYESISEVTYDGKKYAVLSKDKKGIGERNRVEFVGRSVT